MNNRDQRTRNFAAANQSGSMGTQRNRRVNSKRKVIIAILWVIIVILCVLFAIILKECINSGPSLGTESNDETTTAPNDEIAYTVELRSSKDIHRGDLILVNSNFSYVFPDNTANILPIYYNRHTFVSPTSGKNVYSYYTQSQENSAKLANNALDALNSMADDFYNSPNGNNDLFIYDDDGYRTYQEQQELYQAAIEKYGSEAAAQSHCALPGTTEHHTGLSVDLYVYTIDGKMYNLDSAANGGSFSWIYENCYKYGFVLRYSSDVSGVSYEPYHFRYVGYPHAYYMKTNSLSLEEYLDIIRNDHSYSGEHLKFTGDDGLNYEVYYVPSAGDITEVSVPESLPYTISGDNINGFIVTVNID